MNEKEQEYINSVVSKTVIKALMLTTIIVISSIVLCVIFGSIELLEPIILLFGLSAILYVIFN